MNKSDKTCFESSLLTSHLSWQTQFYNGSNLSKLHIMEDLRKLNIKHANKYKQSMISEKDHQ